MAELCAMMYGIAFQDYHSSAPGHHATALRMLWVLATWLLIMSFCGNLKSILATANYEERTQTIDEMLEKDLTHYLYRPFHQFLCTPQGRSPRNDRIRLQAEKKESIYDIEYALYSLYRASWSISLKVVIVVVVVVVFFFLVVVVVLNLFLFLLSNYL